MFTLRNPKANLADMFDAERRLSRKRDDRIDPINELLKLYQSAVDHKSIVPFVENKNHEIFLSFRRESQGILTAEQEKYLCQLSIHESSLSFVGCVLQVMDIFSLNVARKVMEATLKVGEASKKRFLLNPIVRVFDLKVDLEYQEKFKESDRQTKIEILKTFEYIRTKVVLYATQELQESYGLKYSWSGSKFEQNSKMSDKDFIAYQASVMIIKELRYKMLLDEYYSTKSEKLKTAIIAHLPAKIEYYPAKLWPQASQYLQHS